MSSRGPHVRAKGDGTSAPFRRLRASRRATLIALVASSAVSTALTGGCAGHASIHIASLDTRRINATAPLVIRVTPGRCYFWVNERNELCIGMRKAKPSLWGRRFGAEFRLSLVLNGPPAGGSKNYGMSRRTLRAKHRSGYAHTRSASLGGIAAVWDYGGRRIHGRIRAFAEQQSWSVLKGWGANKRVLIVGEFTAVRNQHAGEKILIHTEADGMERAFMPPRPRPVKGPPRNSAQPAQ